VTASNRKEYEKASNRKMGGFKWRASEVIAGFDRQGRSLPVTVGVVETAAGGVECGLRVGEHGKVVALTVQTVGLLATNLHEAKVERLKCGGDMLDSEELAALLTGAERQHATDTLATLLTALTIPIADGRAVEPATKDECTRELTISGLSILGDILPDFLEQARRRQFEGDEWDEWAGMAERLMVAARACRAQVVEVIEGVRAGT
jgi:hypothetical protein